MSRLTRLLSRLDLDAIACIVHESLRAYGAEIGESSAVPWEQSPRWQRYSTLSMVSAILRGEVTSPEASHRVWCENREREGWRFGPEIDAEQRTHPCLVPWRELPVEQRRKDVVFFALVTALTTPMEGE